MFHCYSFLKEILSRIFQKKCVKIIIRAREKEQQRIAALEGHPNYENKIVRKFIKPKINQINFNAKCYKTLLGNIDSWDIDDVTPPPLLQKIGNNDLKDLCLGKELLLKLPKIPHQRDHLNLCHFKQNSVKFNKICAK